MIESCPMTMCPAWRGGSGAARDSGGGGAVAWPGWPRGALPASGPWLHRRTVSRYAQCPFQGWALEVGLVKGASAAADAGWQVHRVIAAGIRAWLDCGADPSGHMAECLPRVRPDVQIDAVDGLRRSIDAIGRFLADLPRDAVIAHRGGRGRRSALLLGHAPTATVASTVDLLYAGASPAEVHEIDFVSGRKVLTASDVRTGLKHRLHAWCLFGAIPDLAAHHVRVWNTRVNALTPVVTFARRDADLAGEAVAAALRSRRDILDALGPAPDDAFPALMERVHTRRRRDFWWPEMTRCAACDACTRCPAATASARDFAADPGAFLAETAAMKAALDKRMRLLRTTVRRTGRDLVFGRTAFGLDKPANPTNPTPGFYRPVETGVGTVGAD